jgi:hypothetical protein
MSLHLAQVNVALARYATDDPRFAEFVGSLDCIDSSGISD